MHTFICIYYIFAQIFTHTQNIRVKFKYLALTQTLFLPLSLSLYIYIYIYIYILAVYSQDWDEDTAVGTALITVSATDADSADTADGQVSYTVVTGATSTLIVNSDTGVISLAAELDRETTAQYVMTIEASDGTNSATATVTISVLDVNDNVPVFNPATYR